MPPSNFLNVGGLVSKRAAADITEGLRAALAEAGRSSFNGLAGLVAAFEESVGRESDLATAHRNMGRDMQNAVLRAYESEVEARKGAEQRESPGRRYKGKLRPALEDSRHVNADGQGLQFLNLSIMHQRARHFARLNWGTAGQGANNPGRSPTFTLSLFNVVIDQLSFNQGPRPAFELPPGLFLAGGRYTFPAVERRGTGAFIPLGELRTPALRGRVAGSPGRFGRPAKAIEGRHFLEAGLEQLTHSLPDRYDLLMQKWLNESMDAGPGAAYKRALRIPGGQARIRNPRAPSLRVVARRGRSST